MTEDYQIGNNIQICTFNIEGISKAKSEVLAKLAYDLDIKILLVQETHTIDHNDIMMRGHIDGFVLASAVHSRIYGIAT